jgi:hypothetical protein
MLVNESVVVHSTLFDCIQYEYISLYAGVYHREYSSNEACVPLRRFIFLIVFFLV